MKNATLLALVVASLAACSKIKDAMTTAAAEPPKAIPARCNEQPQWTTVDDKGQTIGIYICFGERSQLLYATRVLAPVAVPEPPHLTQTPVTTGPAEVSPSTPAKKK